MPSLMAEMLSAHGSIKWNTSAPGDYSGLQIFTQLPNFSVRHLRSNIWNHPFYVLLGWICKSMSVKVLSFLMCRSGRQGFGGWSVPNPGLGKAAHGEEGLSGLGKWVVVMSYTNTVKTTQVFWNDICNELECRSTRLVHIGSFPTIVIHHHLDKISH